MPSVIDGNRDVSPIRSYFPSQFAASAHDIFTFLVGLHVWFSSRKERSETAADAFLPEIFSWPPPAHKPSHRKACDNLLAMPECSK